MNSPEIPESRVADDVILRRITARQASPRYTEPPWPLGLAPKTLRARAGRGGALPSGQDVLIVTWTEAEAQALAMITPGASQSRWSRYTHHWDRFEPQLTSRSPARSAQRLGEWCTLTGGLREGARRICVLHSQLHPATDGPQVPAAALIAQAAAETGAKLVITTGTAGGGPGTQLGDVVVATAVHADCTTRLAGNTWSGQEWPAAALAPGQEAMLDPAVLRPVLAANDSRLPAQYVTRPLQVQRGHVVSVDYFAFYSDDDHYGLFAYDSQLKAEEMDDFAVALGLSRLAVPPAFLSVRCASDPPMPDGSAASLKLAEDIYREYGFAAALGSVAVSYLIAATA